MIDLTILIGLQASGKSSFFRRYLAATHVHVSKDHFRNNRNPARRQVKLITDSLLAGRSVAVDNTNATVELRRELITLGRSFGATITGYYFSANLKDCLARNAMRTGKARVPDVGLFSVAKKIVRPTNAEGFDQLFFVRMADGESFDAKPWIKEENAVG
ncbi:MAG: ATP-binding protein [Gemmataceae bacterium]